MGDPSGFLKIERKTNVYRDSQQRIKDWDEFQENLNSEDLQKQAGRCMDCGVPFCHTGTMLNGSASGCPVYNLIPDWNDAVYKGRWKEALDLLIKTNNFPEFTGRVCPAPCEGACVLGINKPAVTIKNIENNIIEKGFSEGWVQAKEPKKRTGKRIAIVGSGPAGLACADQLNQVGHLITVFERDDRIGGLLMYGIPNMKLEKIGVVERRVKYLEKTGIIFKSNIEIGKDYPAKKLLTEFDSVVLCCGSTVPRDLPIEGREAKGIYFAMDYLKANTKSLLDSNHSDKAYINAKGKKVIVIGGGDTGTDCVATALRQGCQSVQQLEILDPPLNISDNNNYLKTATELPATKRADNNPWPEYPQFYFLDYGQQEAKATQGKDPRQYTVMTQGFMTNSQGKLIGLKIVDIEWQKNENGKKSLHIINNSQRILEADLVFLSMGYIGMENTIATELDLEMTKVNTLKSKYGDFKTNIPGVFCAGDARRGQSLVVWAINEGRGAAKACDQYLMGNSNLPF